MVTCFLRLSWRHFQACQPIFGACLTNPPRLPSKPLSFSTSTCPAAKRMDSLSDEIENLQAYTSGHWLRNDKKEREARWVNFNFSELNEKLVSLDPKSNLVTEIRKIEGHKSKVLICTLDTGKRFAVKFPTFVAGPPKLTTESEVATMTYLQSKIEIPIPKIIDWNSDPMNAIGSEYIIMEHVDGTPLSRTLPKMSSKQILHVHRIMEKTAPMAEWDLPQPCPYSLPPPKELKKHEDQSKLYKEVVLTECLMSGTIGITSAGWAPNQTWEEALNTAEAIYEGAIEEARREHDPDIIADMRKYCPYDLPSETRHDQESEQSKDVEHQ